MSEKLKAANLTAQLHYRGTGNPASVLPRTAISNCFPGLETDFRNFWRRAFEGIVLLENGNYVVDAESKEFEGLVGCRLLKVDEHDIAVATVGPVIPDTRVPLGSASNPQAVSFMEWSNSIARLFGKQGQEVACTFTAAASEQEVLPGSAETKVVNLTMRRFFAGASAAFNPEMVRPGELTHGLCSPWQNDYRECACYYWAASRPDFVNVEPGENGQARGDQWLSKRRTGSYVPDRGADPRLVTYDDLFLDWERALQFVIRGRDAG